MALLLNQMAPELLTAKEVAKLLRISPWQVYWHVHTGILPAGCWIRLGRSIRFHPEKLEAFLERGGQAVPLAKRAKGGVQ